LSRTKKAPNEKKKKREEEKREMGKPGGGLVKKFARGGGGVKNSSGLTYHRQKKKKGSQTGKKKSGEKSCLTEKIPWPEKTCGGNRTGPRHEKSGKREGVPLSWGKPGGKVMSERKDTGGNLQGESKQKEAWIKTEVVLERKKDTGKAGRKKTIY